MSKDLRADLSAEPGANYITTRYNKLDMELSVPFFERQHDVVENQNKQLKNWWDQADKFFKLMTWFISAATLQYIAKKTGSRTIWICFALAIIMLARIWSRIVPIFIDYIIHEISDGIITNLYNKKYAHDAVVVIAIICSLVFLYHFNFHTFPMLINSISEVRSKN